MSLGNYDSAVIECADESNDLFPFSRRGDVLFYPSNSNQRICFATQTQDVPAVCIENKRIGLGTVEPKHAVHLKNKKCFWEDSELRLHASSINVENRQGNMNLGRVAPSHTFPLTGFYTLADGQLLSKSGGVTANSAYQIVDNIPVHHLVNKNEKDAKPIVGCLASEVRDVYNPCVSGFDAQHPGDISTKMIDYSKLVPVLLQCIKDLKTRVLSLEEKMA